MAIKKGTVLISAGDRRILKSFGHKVKEIRDKKKQSTYDLTGDDMPIKSRQHWQGVESGKKNINLTTLFKIAKSLGEPGRVFRPPELSLVRRQVCLT